MTYGVCGYFSLKTILIRQYSIFRGLFVVGEFHVFTFTCIDFVHGMAYPKYCV